jgi:hypothetical protein
MDGPSPHRGGGPLACAEGRGAGRAGLGAWLGCRCPGGLVLEDVGGASVALVASHPIEEDRSDDPESDRLGHGKESPAAQFLVEERVEAADATTTA